MLAIYRRVSTDEQSNTGNSLDNQELRGKQLAAKLGLNHEVYTDAGFSGTISFDKRPDLNRLINDIYKKKVTTVFVTDLDRLSRGDMVQTTLLQNILKESDVKLFDLNGEINLKDINVELLTNIRHLLNAYEVQKTSARIKTVLEKNVRDGKVTGGPLLNYGYTKDANKKLIIDAKEATVVKLIYKLALEGKGTKVIAGILNQQKIPTKRGGVTTGKNMKVRGVTKSEFIWRDAVIYRILTGTIYKGIRVYQGNTYSAPAIIDAITFDTVQEQLKKRDQFKNTTNEYEYLLKGLIDCTICGGKFYGHKRANGKDNAYTCNSNRYGPNCGNRGISIDYMDKLVCDNILYLVQLTDNVFYDKNFQTHINHAENDLIEIQKKIVDAENRLANLLQMAETINIEPVVFKSRLEELQKSLVEYQKEEKRLNKELSISNEKDSILKLTKQLVQKFKKITDFEEKRNFVRNIISSITIEPDGKSITGESTYAIAIYFKINQLENYLIAKKLTLDRNSRKDGKAVTKILTETVSLTGVVFIDETERQFSEYGYVNYNEPLKF